MRAMTHLAFAGLTGVVAAGFGADVGIAGAATLAAGSLLPDIDSQHSGLGRMVKPLSGLLERKVGHRTITHSALGVLGFGVLTSWLLLIYPIAWVWLLVGVMTHILLDTANVSGVPFLYPLRLQFWLFNNRNWRVPYNSPREFTWLGVIAVLAICLVPLSLDGFTPWFHRAMGTPYGAVEDYLRWRDSYEVFATVEGHNLLTNEDISGKFRVIDAINTETILVEDEQGRGYTVGLGQAVNIHSKTIKVWRGEEITSSTYRIDLSGRLVTDLINSLPKGAKAVHINAALELTGEANTPPAVGYYQRVIRVGSTYEVRAGTVGDLAPLANLVIESGSAVIRAEYVPGQEVLANTSVVNSTPQVKAHVLNIPDLPSISGLIIALGDTVAEGEMIARYVDDVALELSEADITAAKQKIIDLEQIIEVEEAAHVVRLEGLEQAVTDAQDKLERTRYLVEHDAEPRNKLLTAEETLRKAEQSVLEQNTTWTSTRTRLEQDLRDANLVITKSEKQQTKELEDQWVRSPVAGLISDIRITGVTTKGVTLEVMILEQEVKTEQLAQIQQ